MRFAGAIATSTIFSWRAWFVFIVTGKLTNSPDLIYLPLRYTELCLIRHMQRIAPTSGSVTRPEDAALCLDLLSKGIANINDRSLAKFQIMFSRLKDKVYGFRYAFDEGNHNPFSRPTEMPMSAAGPGIVRDQAGSADFPSTEMDIMPLGTEGREDYLSQMSTIFENDMLDIDDTLTAWYGSVLNDIGDTGSMRMG